MDLYLKVTDNPGQSYADCIQLEPTRQPEISSGNISFLYPLLGPGSPYGSTQICPSSIAGADWSSPNQGF